MIHSVTVIHLPVVSTNIIRVENVVLSIFFENVGRIQSQAHSSIAMFCTDQIQ
jgi:hypothetical protein